MSVSVVLQETKNSGINHVFGPTGQIPLCAVVYEVKSMKFEDWAKLCKTLMFAKRESVEKGKFVRKWP